MSLLHCSFDPPLFGHGPNFVRRKNGLEPVEYPHPKSSSKFSPTPMVPLSIKNRSCRLRRSCQIILWEADLMRRAMGKDVAEMDRQKIIFVERAKKNGVQRSNRCRNL